MNGKAQETMSALLISAGALSIWWSRWLWPREMRRLSARNRDRSATDQEMWRNVIEMTQLRGVKAVISFLPTFVGAALVVAGVVSLFTPI